MKQNLDRTELNQMYKRERRAELWIFMTTAEAEDVQVEQLIVWVSVTEMIKKTPQSKATVQNTSHKLCASCAALLLVTSRV